MFDSILTTGKRIARHHLTPFLAMMVAAALLVGLLSATSGLSFGSLSVLAEQGRVPSSSPALAAPSYTIHVIADGTATDVTMLDGTVDMALTFAGVTLGAQDEMNVKATDEVYDEMTITVDRVLYRQRTEAETVPFESVTEFTYELKPGESKVKQQGENGKTEYVYEERIVNGTLEKTTKISETVLKEPVNEIVQKGRLAPGATMSPLPYDIELDKDGHPVHYSKVYTGSATAYTNDRGLCGTTTSTGRKAQVGVVAVDPMVIPSGTELYIVSVDGSYVYGYAIAGDTGGAMRAGTAIVDLFMNTYEDCVDFGRRNCNLYVISRDLESGNAAA